MYKLLLIILFLINFQSFAQKLYFTPSLGWGYGLLTKGRIIENNTSFDVNSNFNSKLSLSNFMANPQTGYFLEYRINEKHALGFGSMAGKIEHRTFITFIDRPSIYFYFGGIYRKFGLYYSYNYKKWTFQVGVFRSNNKISSIKNGAYLNSSERDNQGNIKDSITYNYGIQLNSYGITSSLGCGYTFYNVKKGRDRFTINLLFDIGWTKLDGVNTYIQYDYNKIVKSTSVSNGSQLKIFISKPILLYDFKKDKYKLIKK